MDGLQWMGDLPTWISTLAIGFAALSYLGDRKSRAQERDREEKSQATRLSAWAVTDADPEHRAYGVLIANDSGATFYSVDVVATVHKEVQPTLKLVTLPPGRLFVPLESDRGKGKAPWGFGMPPSEYEGTLRPYTVTGGYVVESMEFTDSFSQRWRTDRHAVLQRVVSSTAEI
ncbi:MULTISPECIES: hypothetical protein [Microbacterium]|uniref:hypothetical protein n=1 Tax=Microbacterium TaxID=33882 RepID=UPI002786EC9B|nr:MULTISPECIES: hypothetical protein [Microbacterium]MDQ1083967.1 hypothetical protein [Microbacterium sp. SORGH_AS_0344]MDQ1170753.1 hypothetical protein [Microbacterium proteolyticum]